jgi:Tol biopolymer transport system component
VKPMMFVRSLAAVAAAAFVATTGAADLGNKVLFVSNRDGNAQIYVMEADGSGERALTVGTEENTEPAWSHDGKRIVFTSYRGGDAGIYVMDAGGNAQKRLSSVQYSDNSPSWTPDGRIVFRSMRDGWANFYAMDADGSNVKQLTSTQSDKGAPTLSPDGKLIAYIAHGETGVTNIHVVPTSGGDAKNLTGALPSGQKLPPSWSPDSRWIAYSEYKNGALAIRVIGSDGSDPHKITDNIFSNASPTWSPDGRRIAFVSSREGSRVEMARGDIYVMNADGSGATNVTRHPAEDNYPVWAADGSSIYFVSLRDGNAQIYTVPSDGGEARRLTHNNGYDLMIRPQSTQVRQDRASIASLASSPSK